MKPLYTLLPEEERGAARRYLSAALGTLAVLAFAIYISYVILDQRRTIAHQRTEIEQLRHLVDDLRGDINTYRFQHLDDHGKRNDL